MMLELLIEAADVLFLQALLPQLMHTSRAWRRYAITFVRRVCAGHFIHKFLLALLDQPHLASNQLLLHNGLNIILDYICARVWSRGICTVSLHKFATERHSRSKMLLWTAVTVLPNMIGMGPRNKPTISTHVTTEYLFRSGPCLAIYSFSESGCDLHFRRDSHSYRLEINTKAVGVQWNRAVIQKTPGAVYTPLSPCEFTPEGLIAGERARAASGEMSDIVATSVFLSGRSVIAPGDQLPNSEQALAIFDHHDLIFWPGEPAAEEPSRDREA